jgi:tetratricopeptide (TPR) repeat protein
MKTTMKKTILTCLILLLAVLLTCGCSEFAHNGEASWQLKPGYDPNALVLLGHIDYREHETLISWPRVAFAIGDGTIVLTAEHCVDRPPSWTEPLMSPEVVVISPYYGDIYNCRILAVEKKTDLAILKAPWPIHPALALADEEELRDAEQVTIFSRPIRKSKKPQQLGRQIRTTTLTIDRLNITEPIIGMRLRGTGPVQRGWSGSAMLLPESAKVTGIVCALTGFKLGIPGLFNVIFVFDTVGTNTESIWKLLKQNDLEFVAKSYYPSPFKPVTDAQPAFSGIMDYFDTLLKKENAESLEIAGKLVTLRPESSYIHLLLAISADKLAHEPDSQTRALLAIAESSYQKALQLAPESASIHAAYGNFLVNRHRKEQALTETESALDIDPNNNLAAINRIIILTQIEPNKARKYAEQLIYKDPNNPDYWFHYGGALSQLGKYEQGLKATEKAVELNPKGDYYGGLADILVKLDRLNKAERYYKKMTKSCGCQQCWFNYANFLLEHRPKKLKRAEKALSKAQSKAYMLRVSEEDMAELKRRIQKKKAQK